MEGSKITFISHSLAQPSSIPEANIDTINLLLEKYPYFTPAWYIAAAKTSHPHLGSSLNNHLLLRQVNWVKYQEFLQEAAAVNSHFTDSDDIIIPTIPEDAFLPATIEILSEENENDETIVDNVQYGTMEKPYTEYIEEQSGEEYEVQSNLEEEPLDKNIIPPVYAEDYFLHEGIEVSSEIPEDIQQNSNEEQVSIDTEEEEEEKAKSLMVMMSFNEWLQHFNTQKTKADQEAKEQKALKSMWQREKLAAAMEEENEEIPENVFKMAVDSIQKEDDLVSESLAEILIKQGKHDKAIDMYRKLSLRNPQKNAYFARKIEALIKDNI